VQVQPFTHQLGIHMNPAKLLYARMHVQMNSKQTVSSWTDEEILLAFSLLRKPEIKFEDWVAQLVDVPADQPVEQTNKPTTDDAVAEHNSNVIGTLPAVAPFFQVIKE